MAYPYITIEFHIGSEKIEISKTSIYRLVAGGALGLEAADFETLTTEYASMDGGYLDGVKIPPRQISIKFEVSSLPQTETIRKKLISFFAPRKQGTLIVHRADRSRKIAFYVANAPEFKQDNIIYQKLQVTVDLVCPDPFFEDAEETTVEFLKPAALLSFPFNSLSGVGITSGVLIVSDHASLTNNGDVPVGIVCDILAKGGTIVNPKISLNGQYVRVLRTLTPGDTVRIDTNKGRKNIYINGESKFIFDRKSIFFDLPVGASDIVVSADAGIEDAKSSFTYSFKYLGV